MCLFLSFRSGYNTRKAKLMTMRCIQCWGWDLIPFWIFFHTFSDLLLCVCLCIMCCVGCDVFGLVCISYLAIVKKWLCWMKICLLGCPSAQDLRGIFWIPLTNKFSNEMTELLQHLKSSTKKVFIPKYHILFSETKYLFNYILSIQSYKFRSIYMHSFSSSICFNFYSFFATFPALENDSVHFVHSVPHTLAEYSRKFFILLSRFPLLHIFI